MRREDIAVVGGGIAGTFAALTARKAGASVTLIDEQPAVGGYLRWSLVPEQGLDAGLDGLRGFELARQCWELLYDARVNVQLNSTAWGLFEENVLGVVNPESSYQLKADAVILASGSTDVAVPFRGWELAGVMTARAALIAMNLHRVLPGRRVALIGNGPDLTLVRESLELAGAEVAAHIQSPAGAIVGGEGVVEWAQFGEDHIPVDAVVTAHGVQPDPALALQALADTGYSGLSRAHVPLRSEHLLSSVENVYVIGDAAGICTTAEAVAEGVVAGEAAANGRNLDDALERLARVRSAERVDEMRRLQPRVSAR